MPESHYESLRKTFNKLITELENIRHPAVDGIVKSWQILLKNMDDQLTIEPLPVSKSQLIRDLQQSLAAFPSLIESCEPSVRTLALSTFNRIIHSQVPEVPNKCELENEQS